MYSSIDKMKLSITTWLCVKFKYKLNNMIETSNFVENSSFEKKCLNVGLQISTKISRREKQTTLNKINRFLSKLHHIFVQKIYITT